MTSKPTVCSLLFLLREGEILLAMKKRGLGAGHYNGAGGKVEPGETVEQAAIRECEEEIGVTPLSINKVAEIQFEEVTEDKVAISCHVYVCYEWEGEPIETEEMNPKWFNIRDIPFDTMWADDIYWLPLVLVGRKLKATFTFGKNDQVIAHTLTEIEDFTHEPAEIRSI